MADREPSLPPTRDPRTAPTGAVPHPAAVVAVARAGRLRFSRHRNDQPNADRFFGHGWELDGQRLTPGDSAVVAEALERGLVMVPWFRGLRIAGTVPVRVAPTGWWARARRAVRVRARDLSGR